MLTFRMWIVMSSKLSADDNRRIVFVWRIRYRICGCIRRVSTRIPQICSKYVLSQFHKLTQKANKMLSEYHNENGHNNTDTRTTVVGLRVRETGITLASSGKKTELCCFGTIMVP